MAIGITAFVNKATGEVKPVIGNPRSEVGIAATVKIAIKKIAVQISDFFPSRKICFKTKDGFGAEAVNVIEPVLIDKKLATARVGWKGGGLDNIAQIAVGKNLSAIAFFSVAIVVMIGVVGFFAAAAVEVSLINNDGVVAEGVWKCLGEFFPIDRKVFVKFATVNGADGLFRQGGAGAGGAADGVNDFIGFVKGDSVVKADFDGQRSRAYPVRSGAGFGWQKKKRNKNGRNEREEVSFGKAHGKDIK